MEHNVQVISVFEAFGEVDDVHDPVCFLQQIQAFIVLLFLDKRHGAVVQLVQHDGNLILRDFELFIVMTVERLVFVRHRAALRCGPGALLQRRVAGTNGAVSLGPFRGEREFCAYTWFCFLVC